MKILREGNLPGDKTYTGTCSNCSCRFEFQAKEAKETSDNHNGTLLSIACPQQGCGHTVNVDKYPKTYSFQDR